MICSCELIWFPNLLKELKDRDDEMTQKKKPMCTMVSEHREYFVQTMPIERMNCMGKNLGRSAMRNGGIGMDWEMRIFTIFGTIGICLL